MNERLDAAAITLTLLAPTGVGILGLLVFVLRWPAGLGAGIFYSLIALPVGVLAIYKSRTGGGITFTIGAFLLVACLMTNHYVQYYVPVAALSIAGGTLHLLRPR